MSTTWELVGLDIAHRREQRQLATQAQGLVDELDQDIRSLRRQLAAAQRANAGLVLERGRRNNEVLLRRMARQH